MSDSSLIIYNARVYTVDENNPMAEAVVVQGDRIIFVGSDVDAMQFAGESTQLIDGRGRTLMPGFIDAHFHLAWGAESLYGAQLDGVTSMEEVVTIIQEWAAAHPDAPWVVAEGIFYTLPDPETPLTRDLLDKIIPDRPLVVVAFDQHSSFANTLALEAAGILHGTDEVMLNGEIIVDEDGVATGELYEMDAMAFINRARPSFTFEKRIDMLRQALALCASLGITSVHNMDGDVEQANLYAYLEDRDEMTLRVYMPFWAKPEMELSHVLEQSAELRQKYQTPYVRGGAVKFFMDGVYESSTAVTLDGYPDEPKKFGVPIWSAERFAEYVSAVDKHGFQIAVHAVGDGAVRLVLDGYETAQKINGRRDSRHRVEHIELVDPADVPRFAELDVVASMQPLHSPIDDQTLGLFTPRIRDDRWDMGFAWRSLRDANALLVFGTDWPVVPASPFLELDAAVNRKPWRPGHNRQVLTLAESIQAYTRDAAYVEFQEDVKGQLKADMLADLVLLDRDIFHGPTSQLTAVQADLTICGGRIVYQRLETGTETERY